MKKVFNLEDYKGNYVMHCNTIEKAITFLKFLDSKDKKWSTRSSYLSYNFWQDYKEATCYSFNTGQYSDMAYCLDKNYTILEFDDFKWGEEKVKAKLVVNGKEIEVEISEEEFEKLKVKKERTGFERVNEGESYYSTTLDGDIYGMTEHHIPRNDKDFRIADYYTDKKLAINCIRADKLLRQLRRFAVEHRKEELDWTNGDLSKYYISYDYNKGCINYLDRSIAWTYRNFGQIYFDSEETAELAIETFRDELEWYFTEFEDSL